MAGEATRAEVEEIKMQKPGGATEDGGKSNAVAHREAGEGEDFSVVVGGEGGRDADSSSYVFVSGNNGDLGSDCLVCCEPTAGGGVPAISDQNEAPDARSDPQREEGVVKVPEFGSVGVRCAESTTHVAEESQHRQNSSSNAVIQPELNQSSKGQVKFNGKTQSDLAEDTEKDDRGAQIVVSSENGHGDACQVVADGDVLVDLLQGDPMTIDGDGQVDVNSENREAKSVNNVEKDNREDQAVVTENDVEKDNPEDQAVVTENDVEKDNREDQAVATENNVEKDNQEDQAVVTENDVEKDNPEDQAVVTENDVEKDNRENQAVATENNVEKDNQEDQAVVTENNVEKDNQEDQAVVTENNGQVNLDRGVNMMDNGDGQVNQGQEASVTIVRDSYVELKVGNNVAESGNDVEKDNQEDQATLCEEDDQVHFNKESNLLGKGHDQINQGHEASMEIDASRCVDLNTENKEANSANDIKKDKQEDHSVASGYGDEFQLDQEITIMTTSDDQVDQGQASLIIDGHCQADLKIKTKGSKSATDVEDDQEDSTVPSENGVQVELDQEANYMATGDILVKQCQKAPMAIGEDGQGDLNLENKKAGFSNYIEDHMKSEALVSVNARVYLEHETNCKANDNVQGSKEVPIAIDEDYQVDLNLENKEADYPNDVEHNVKETQTVVSEIDLDQKPTSLANVDVEVFQNQEAPVGISDGCQVDLNLDNREAKSVNEGLVDGTPSVTVMDLASSPEMASCHLNAVESESEITNELVSLESGGTLSTDHRGELNSETVICHDAVDGIQNTTGEGLVGLSENAVSLPPVGSMAYEAEGDKSPVKRGEDILADLDSSRIVEIAEGESLITNNFPPSIDSGANLHALHNNNVVAKDGFGASSIFDDIPGCAENGDNFHADLNSNMVMNVGEEASSANSNFPGCAESVRNEMVNNGPVGIDSFSKSVVNAARCGIVFGSMDCEEQLPAFQFGEAECLKFSVGGTGCAGGRPAALAGNLKLECESASASNSREMSDADATVSGPFVAIESDGNGEKSSNSVPDSVVENDTGDKLVFPEAENVEELPKDETSISSANALDAEAVKKPFYYLIKIPRLDIDSVREKIKDAQIQVDRKTQYRDSIRAEIQKKRAASMGCSDNFGAARSEERAIRELLKSKRQEIDSVQSLINKVKNAISVDDIDVKIHYMEHRIEHESLPLAEEKYYLREMKQLKSLREQLSSNVGKQDGLKQALGQREQIEERLKSLKKELESLKDKVSSAEEITIAAKMKYSDEKKMLSELQAQFRGANDIRQEAFADLQVLRKQLYEKHKYMRMYKDSAEAASKYAADKNTDELQRLCVDQVNKTMDLWNKNDEFRKEYVRCNMRSTLWRLKTFDGRSLGPDEDPPVLVNNVSERVHHFVPTPAKAISPIVSVAEEKQHVHVETEKPDAKSEEVFKPIINEIKPMNDEIKSKKSTKNDVLLSESMSVSARNVAEETGEKPKQSKEEVEMARKAEEIRKEEVAAKLKEQRKLEEKAKAKEAQERKKRNAEKARAKAELRAQKEAEEKEKEREKRARKKERKKGGASEVAGGSNEGDNASTVDTSNESSKEPESSKEKPTTVTKRPQKPLTKAASKTKSMPLPLRNRSKRRMQSWMWVLLTVLVVLALFFAGNSGLSFRSFLQSYGF